MVELGRWCDLLHEQNISASKERDGVLESQEEAKLALSAAVRLMEEECSALNMKPEHIRHFLITDLSAVLLRSQLKFEDGPQQKD